MTSLVTYLETPQKEAHRLFDSVKDRLKALQTMPQYAINVFVPIEEEKEPELRKVLARIAADTHNNDILPFSQFADTLHFARFLIYEGAKHPDEYGSYLVFIADVDGTIESFFKQMAITCPAALDIIFGAGKGYPPRSRLKRSTRIEFLLTHQIPAQAFYINTIGRGVKQILEEDEIHKTLQNFLNQLDKGTIKSAKKLRKEIIQFVKSNEELSWALNPAEKPSWLWRTKEKARFVGLLGLGSVVVAWSWPAILTWILLVQAKERHDIPEDQRPPLARLNQLRANEDIAVHNQFSAAGFVKPGIIRQMTTRSVLALAQFSLRHVFNNGNLAGVPILGLDGVDTIHFAHWILLDEDQRLLFVSNYDGSLESYMVDFIDKVSWGLNIVFSNGQGYPRTNWLFFDGAKDEQKFKDYLGNHQLETLVWHTPYKHLSAVNIANNAEIRKGLRGRMSEKRAKKWLQRF